MKMMYPTHAGQLALRDKSKLVGLTNRHKDYSQMSKGKVQIELVDILTGILQMKDEEYLVGCLTSIPKEKLPRFQKESWNGKEIILKSQCREMEMVINAFPGRIIIKSGMCIEDERIKDRSFKRYLVEFTKKLFEK